MVDVNELFSEQLIEEMENWEPSNKSLSDVGALAVELMRCMSEVTHQELALSQAKAKLKKVQEEDLPAALSETGLSSITLATGEKLTIEPYYGASIPPENRDEAFQWLRKNGYGDIIKHTVAVDFKKGEGEDSERAFQLLRSAGFEAKDEEKIAPPTLKAFARVEVEEGRSLPPCFNVYVGQRAKIKR